MAAAGAVRLATSVACYYLIYGKMTGKKRAKEETSCQPVPLLTPIRKTAKSDD